MWFKKKEVFNTDKLTTIEAWALTNIKISPQRFLDAMNRPGSCSSIFDDARKYIPIAKQFLLVGFKEESNKDGKVL
jgi:hypothetical protein